MRKSKPKYNVRLKMKDGEWITINNVYHIVEQIMSDKVKFLLEDSFATDQVVEVKDNDVSYKEVKKIN